MRSYLPILVFFVLPCLHIYAQEAGQTVDTLKIEEVLINATRSAVNDPVTFQTIKQNEIIEVHAGQDPSVLLQQLSPSIISYSDAGTDIGNYAQFRLRGISQNRINITLNGVPLNDMIDQGVYFSNFSDFGSSLQSIQIQRGVAASNVGVASYGGAVNFESANIFNNDAGGRLQLTTGSFGTLRTSGEIRTGLMSNGIGAYGRISRTTTDGFKHHSGSDAYSIFGSIGYLGKKDVLKLTGFMGKTENDQSYLPVLLDDIDADPRTNYNHPNDTDDFEQELVQVQYARTLSALVSLDATLYYGGARGVFPFGIDNQTQFVFGLENDHYGFLSHLTFEQNNWTLSGGVQGYHFDRTNFEYIAPDVANPYARDFSQKQEISVFGKFKFQKEKMTVYTDLQVRSVELELTPDLAIGNDFNFSDNWVFANFVGGLNYQFNRQHSLYFSYGKSGREPTRTDILNGALLAEKVADFELGWRMKHKNIDLNANLFRMNFENEISQVGALVARSYMEVRKNVPQSRRSGAELTLQYQPGEKLGVTINGAYLSTNVTSFENGGEIFSNVQHIFSPKWIISPSVDLELFPALKMKISGRYVSDSFMELGNNNAFILPAHTILNTQFDFKVTDRWNLKLMLNNLFDKRYFTDGAPVDLDFDGLVEGPGYRIQPPRHFYLMFTVNI